MSKQSVLFLGVNVEWDKETDVLDIRDENGKQLGLFRVTEED